MAARFGAGITPKERLEADCGALLEEGGLTRQQTSWLKALNRSIHKKESGYLSDGKHYLRVGLSALSCIQRILEERDAKPPGAILDYPCGYGRVLRWLQVAFPSASHQAADVDRRAVRFCRKAFGVFARPCKSDPGLNHWEDRFDLIWCGSLLTHVREEMMERVFSFFFEHLNPGGLCIVTTHGNQVEHLLKSRQINYSLSNHAVADLLIQYREKGFGYVDYEPLRKDYGISLSSEMRIRQLAAKAGDWKCVCFDPAGWDNHQDVYAFLKGRN